MKVKESVEQMENLKEFIEKNYNEFNNLECSEIINYDVNEFNNPLINYLIKNYRFDYKGICVYYVEEDNEIWVENLLS